MTLRAGNPRVSSPSRGAREGPSGSSLSGLWSAACCPGRGHREGSRSLTGTSGPAPCHCPPRVGPFASFSSRPPPSVPVAFLRACGIGRKGDEPRVALLAKQTHTRTHTQPQKNDCSKSHVYIMILTGIDGPSEVCILPTTWGHQRTLGIHAWPYFKIVTSFSAPTVSRTSGESTKPAGLLASGAAERERGSGSPAGSVGCWGEAAQEGLSSERRSQSPRALHHDARGHSTASEAPGVKLFMCLGTFQGRLRKERGLSQA